MADQYFNDVSGNIRYIQGLSQRIALDCDHELSESFLHKLNTELAYANDLQLWLSTHQGVCPSIGRRRKLAKQMEKLCKMEQDYNKKLQKALEKKHNTQRKHSGFYVRHAGVNETRTADVRSTAWPSSHTQPGYEGAFVLIPEISRRSTRDHRRTSQPREPYPPAPSRNEWFFDDRSTGADKDVRKQGIWNSRDCQRSLTYQH